MKSVPEYFGSMVFDDKCMKATLSADVYKPLRKTIDEGAQLDEGVANAVAAAMKDWALSKGATHYQQRARERRTRRIFVSLGRPARHL